MHPVDRPQRDVSARVPDGGRAACRPCATSRSRFAPASTWRCVVRPGCGKSTLLHMLGCVDAPTSGTLLLRRPGRGRRCRTRQRSLLRLRQIGFVFQRFFLLPMLTAAENVELPQSEAGVPTARSSGAAHARAARLRRPVGARRSSAGAAVWRRDAAGGHRARAGQPPRLLLADEPTGELDEATGQQIAGAARSRQRGRHGTGHRHARRGARRAGAAAADDARWTHRERRQSPVIGRLALRSLTAHPVRSAVLAAGFGAGVAVMAILLGVAEIVLRRRSRRRWSAAATSSIRLGRCRCRRGWLLSGTLQSDALRARIDVVSPYRRERPLPDRQRPFGRGCRRAAASPASSVPSAIREMSGARGVAQHRRRSRRGRTKRPSGCCAASIASIRFPTCRAGARRGRSGSTSTAARREARFYLTFLVGPHAAERRTVRRCPPAARTRTARCRRSPAARRSATTRSPVGARPDASAPARSASKG